MKVRTVICVPGYATRLVTAAITQEHTAIVIPHVNVVILDNVVYQRISPECWANVVEGTSDDFVTPQEKATLDLLNDLLGFVPA